MVKRLTAFLFALTIALGATFAHGEESTVTNVVVAPLTSSHWTQGSPYNDYSPKGTTAFTSGWEAGCVAIAAAQELYYWQWPWSLGSIRETSHPVMNESPLAIRFDGNVPFDWDNMPDSFSDGGTLAQKHAVAHLVLACQSLVQMQFVSAGGLASKNLPGTMEWFEFDRQVDPKSGDEAIAALCSDFEFGSPVQTGINFKGYGGHEVVGLGYATSDDKKLIWLNLGWGGGSDGWYDLSEADASETIIKSVQLGFRPIKSVQIEPVAPVSGDSVTLNWHLPNCYTNKISGFTVATKKLGNTTTTWSDDFSTAKGRSNNANEVRIVNGALKAWDGTASGMYIWDDVIVPTADSEMTYDVGSSYMSGMTVRFEAKVDGEWQTIHTVAVNGEKEPNYYNWGSTTAADPVSLESLAGQPIQLRYVVEYTNGSIFSSDDASVKIDNLAVSNVKTFEDVSSATLPASARTTSFTSLESGEVYAFTVTPVMSDESAAVTQTVTTTIGSPAASPVIGAVTMSPKGSNLVQEGFYTDIAMGWNIIDVACQNVATLEAFPSHQSVLPQSKVEVVDNGGGSFSINIDATEVAAKWAGQRMILTLKATNATGETTYKDLELRLVASGVPENVPGGKVWTGEDAMFGENYTAKWANNDLPSNGDKATFYVNDGDIGAMMILDLLTPTELGYVNVTGKEQLTITGNSSEVLTIDMLKNDVPVVVSTTKFKVGKAVPSENILISSGSSLDCEVDQSRSGYIKKYSPGYPTALTDSALWKGTVVFDNYTAAGQNLSDYGNTSSKVRLSGVSGWLANNTTYNPTIELVDNGSTPALNWSNGSTGAKETIKTLTGTGTFKTSGSGGAAERVVINNIDDFTGSFDLSLKRIVIGDSDPTTSNNGSITINSGKSVAVAEGKTWKATGGFYFKGSQTITVNGTLNGAITAEGTGTTLALKPTSAVTAASLNMANNTISIEKSAAAASAVTVSGAATLTGATIALNLTGEPGNAVALMSAGSFTGVESASLTGLDNYTLEVEGGVLYAKALNPSYSGPEPTAMWISRQFEEEHGGYSIVTNNFNTINSDGNIEIGSSATLGATITLPANTYTQATILVKYSIPAGGAPVAQSVPASVFSTYDLGALASKDSSNVTGYYLDGTVKTGSYAFSSTAPSLPQEGYILLSNWSGTTNLHGTAVYAGETIATLSGGEKSGLRFTGANRFITKVGIGGPTAEGAKPWAGMVIKGVAVFDKWLEPSDIAGYEFPKPVAKPEPIAVWHGDFGVATKNGCSLDRHGNSFADGVITITTDEGVANYEGVYHGVDVNLESGTNAITVIVKYSDLSYSTANGRMFLTSCAESTKKIDRAALRLTVGGKIKGSLSSDNTGPATSDIDELTDAPPQSGYMAFSYGPSNSERILLCSGDAEGSINTTNYWYTGYSGDVIYGATVGGYRQNANPGQTWYNATGMKIEAIAVFTKMLTEEERNAYRFPEPVAEPLPALSDDPTEEEVAANVAAAGLADEEEVSKIVTTVAEYNSFRDWAASVDGGVTAVIASAHAADSYLLGVTTLLASEPEVTFEAFDVGESDGEFVVQVSIKDGGTSVAANLQKVKSLFRATKKLGDWTSDDNKLTPSVTVDGDVFKVSLEGDEPVMFMKLGK